MIYRVGRRCGLQDADAQNLAQEEVPETVGSSDTVIGRSAEVSVTVDAARIVPLNDLQTKGQRLVQLDRLRVEGNFDLAGTSPSEFTGGKAEVVVEDDQRNKASLEGTVAFINPPANADGTYRVWVTVENRQIDGKWLLVPGEWAKLTIHTADRKGRGHSADPLGYGDVPAGESEVTVYPTGHLPIWTQDGNKQHAGLLIRYRAAEPKRRAGVPRSVRND